MGRERFLIHAFSGRRRPGDVQHFLDELQSKHPGATIYTVSLDIIINQDLGDVSKEGVRNFRLRGVRERAVVGLLAGPPCETWSEARGKEATLSLEALPHRSPRVIPDRDSLGRRASLALRLRGLEQILMATFCCPSRWSCSFILLCRRCWSHGTPGLTQR